jgi:hypothetical protein
VAARRRKDVDLTGVRQRGGKYQVRVFGSTDPVTGKQVILTGSADTQDAAVELRDGFRKQVRERTGVRTNVTLGFLEKVPSAYMPARLRMLRQAGALPDDQRAGDLALSRDRARGEGPDHPATGTWWPRP